MTDIQARDYAVEMNIGLVDKECGDTETEVIKDEIKIFFGDNAEKFTFKNKYFYLNDTNICLSGDNLITKKQMWRRSYHKRKAPDGVKNDDKFLAYIVLPRIQNNYRSNVNSTRNSTFGYNDNPFLFFYVLNKMYKCEFDESKTSESLDYVEKSIVLTKAFWELFGQGVEGYAECEKAFCVSGILKLCEEDKYKVFLRKEIPTVEDLQLYDELLKKLRILRREQMQERLGVMRFL